MLYVYQTCLLVCFFSVPCQKKNIPRSRLYLGRPWPSWSESKGFSLRASYNGYTCAVSLWLGNQCEAALISSSPEKVFFSHIICTCAQTFTKVQKKIAKSKQFRYFRNRMCPINVCKRTPVSTLALVIQTGVLATFASAPSSRICASTIKPPTVPQLWILTRKAQTCLFIVYALLQRTSVIVARLLLLLAQTKTRAWCWNGDLLQSCSLLCIRNRGKRAPGRKKTLPSSRYQIRAHLCLAMHHSCGLPTTQRFWTL